MARKAKSFESAKQELEEITAKLEDETLTLDERIKHYKKGIELSAYCQQLLSQAEQELYILGEKGFEKIEGNYGDE